jgi:hypothetical protein
MRTSLDGVSDKLKKMRSNPSLSSASQAKISDALKATQASAKNADPATVRRWMVLQEFSEESI